MNLIGIVSLVCRLSLVAAAVLSIKKFSLWPKRRPLPIVIYGILIIFFIAAQLVFVKASALTDEITLTALGDKNPNASAEEIYVHSFLVDGKNVLVDNPISGKWFWIGDTYAWRIENDTRQPVGTTRSITFKVPVGQSRVAIFEGDVWRGKVAIDTEEQSRIVDTYAESATLLPVELGKSNTINLILDQVMRVTLFGVVVLMGVLFCIILQKTLLLNMDRCWQKYGGKMLYGTIALIAFCAMFWLADRQSFWVDEILELSLIRGSLEDAVRGNLQMIDVTPPLYNICATLWYRIAPYGQRWLLVISMIPVALSVYVAGLIGERIRNSFCGCLMATMLAFSETVWNYQAHELRSYAFMGLFSAMTLYCYIRRNETLKTWKWHILFGFSMMFLAMSHYFGMLACGCIFLVDAAAFCRKKIPFRAVVAYSLVGIVSLAWLSSVYAITLSRRSTASIASWYSVPTVGHIRSLLIFLAGGQTFTWNLLLLGVAVSIVVAVRHNAFDPDRGYRYYMFSEWLISFPIVVLFIYGNCINQASTMWQERYFLFIPIYVVLFSSLGIDDFVALLANGKNLQKVQVILGAFLIFMFSADCIASQASLPSYQPFREAANYLNTQANHIYNKDTLVVSTCGGADVIEAWEEYFIMQQGKRDPINACQSQYSITKNDVQKYNRIYIQYSHIPLISWLWDILSTDFTVVEEHPELQITVYQRNGT